jgi:hypothetical protein
VKKPVKGKPVPKAKVHHRKPVRVTPAIKAARHAAALKAAKTRAAHAKTHKKRTLALGDGVGCCSAEALAASLRLAGAAVSDDDVLALHWRAGGGVDTGVSILAALEAASVWGLAGVRPVSFAPVICSNRPEPTDLAAGIVLGLELPGPHAVLAEPDRWWSWGEPYDPASWPDAIIEEAWEVIW